MRCAEELVKLQVEMEMTRLGYSARADIWLKRASDMAQCGSTYSGHVAKAYEMEHVWRRLAARAKAVFDKLTPQSVIVATEEL